MTTYGTALPRDEWRLQRDLIGQVDQSQAGNIILRIGRDYGFDRPGWQQTGHIVLTPDEARALVDEIESRLSPGSRT